MLVFQWVFVWITSMIKLPAMAAFLFELPEGFQNMFGMPIREVATTAGRLSLAYIDPVVLFISAAWGITRGSDAVSGEIGRGTMEMLLAQPVRRVSILFTHAVVTTAGAAVLAFSAWLGTVIGMATNDLEQSVPSSLFVPAALNLFALTFFVAAISTLASSWDRDRWRTIGLVGGIYMLALILKVIARASPRFDWLMYFTFLGAYQPQVLVTDQERAWRLLASYNGTLLGLGLLAYVAAAIIFSRRDLPAPL